MNPRSSIEGEVRPGSDQCGNQNHERPQERLHHEGNPCQSARLGLISVAADPGSLDNPDR
ncbi:MAG TPA: hypothetical protein VM492_13955 [Sumerlaeia bacterium]|nr:hypothetical protein [Sumerlaeia bacterium]